MLNRIRSIFEALDKPSDGQAPGPGVGDKELAACALLVEAAAMDGAVGAEEEKAIRRIAGQCFGLKAGEIETLMEEAAKAQSEANQLIRFTRKIKDHFSEEERVELVEMLWEVAYADGVLHDYEASLLRRIGGLIYVSDHARGAARKRVLARLGIDP